MTEAFRNVLGKWTIDKDPQALLDYAAGFGLWLDAVSDTIQSHVVTKVVGVTLQASGIVNGAKDVLVWVSGGTKHRTAYITIKIVTVGGRTDERTLHFSMVDK